MKPEIGKQMREEREAHTLCLFYLLVFRPIQVPVPNSTETLPVCLTQQVSLPLWVDVLDDSSHILPWFLSKTKTLFSTLHCSPSYYTWFVPSETAPMHHSILLLMRNTCSVVWLQSFLQLVSQQHDQSSQMIQTKNLFHYVVALSPHTWLLQSRLWKLPCTSLVHICCGVFSRSGCKMKQTRQLF